MGGQGSGRFGPRWDARDTVEASRSLDMAQLVRNGWVRPGESTVGGFRWSDGSSMGYATGTRDGVPRLALSYTLIRGDERREVEQVIQLLSTPCHFGGERWWFRCPLIIGGRYCGRRVRKVYLPPGGTYYGCRHCHDLTYTSCQESHRWDALARSLGTDPALMKTWR